MSERSWSRVFMALVVALVLALPLTVYLLVRGGGGGDDSDARPSPAQVTPGRPDRSAAPDGRISLDTLGDSVLDIPPWPRDNVRGSSGHLRFRNGVAELEPRTSTTGRPPFGNRIVIVDATYGDVDGDGATETVAQIGCIIEGGSEQLVVFDRDTAGQIVTIGTVVATTGEIRDIEDGSARVAADGAVTVTVGDYQRCCDVSRGRP